MNTGPVAPPSPRPAVVAPPSKVEHPKHQAGLSILQARTIRSLPPVQTSDYVQMESSELSDSEEDVLLSESGPTPVLGKRDRISTPTPPLVKVEKKGKAKEKKAPAPRRMVLFVFSRLYDWLTFSFPV